MAKSCRDVTSDSNVEGLFVEMSGEPRVVESSGSRMGPNQPGPTLWMPGVSAE